MTTSPLLPFLSGLACKFFELCHKARSKSRKLSPSSEALDLQEHKVLEVTLDS